MRYLVFFAILAVATGSIIIAVRSHDAKIKKLITEGKALQRERTFWLQQTLFTTQIDSVDGVYHATNKPLLDEAGVKHEIDSDSIILFTNKASGGSFTSTLRAVGQNDGKFQYIYQIDQYQGPDGYMKPKCLRAANILLTSIEKAFLQLDSDTSVIRRTAAFKQK